MSHKSRFPVDKAEDLYKQGKTDPEIAKELGFGSTTVFMWRNRNLLPSNRSISIAKAKEAKRKHPAIVEEIKEQRRLGYSSYGEYETAKETGTLHQQAKGSDYKWNWWKEDAQ